MTRPGRVRFRIAGPFAVWLDDRPLADRDIGSRKGRTLLKLLIVERPHVVSTDRIIEALWGSEPPLKAEQNVAALVSRLRAVFGADAVAGGRGGYAFASVTGLEVDLDHAAALVQESEARLAAGEPSLARAAADAALETLGAGRLLEDEPYAPWAEQAQSGVSRLLRRARRSAWRASLELADARAAAEIAETAVAADPLDEEAYRALMRAHRGAGEQAIALAVFDRLRNVLAEELGVDPAPETQALHMAILRDESIPEEPAAPVLPTSAVPTDAGFVGRDEELRRLSADWSEAAAGRPALVLIAGAAGVGKTRLADEIALVARATGGLVAEARCYEAERSLFLQPVIDAVRGVIAGMRPDVVREIVGDRVGTLSDLVPEIGTILRPLDYRRATPEVERRMSFEAIASLLRSLARRQPVLVSLDDLQNAGAATLELLHFLMRRLSADRLLVLATVRTEEGQEVMSTLTEVARGMDLGPLPDSAVTELARRVGAGDIADRILSMTRGHALFVVETLRSLTEGPAGLEAGRVPESLRGAVLARTRRTGEAVEEMLRAAAVLGPTFELATVAGLLDLTLGEATRRAERAAQARLLTEAGANYEFANDLIQEVLYEATPLPARTSLHRRARELLRANPEASASHASAAGDWSGAATAWMEAGERAARRYANLDAERMFDQSVLAATRAEDALAEARARHARGSVREALADYDGAYEDHSIAVRLAREAGERTIEMQSLREMGGDILVGRGDRTLACVPFLEAALTIAEELGDRSVEVSTLSRLAIVSSNLLRFDMGFAYGQRALARARELGDELAVARALDGLKMAAAYTGDFPTLQAILPELERILRGHGELRLLQWAVFESSFEPLARGRWEQALERIETALALTRRTGSRPLEPMIGAQLGSIHRSRGEYDLALRLGRESASVAHDIGHPWMIAIAESMLGWTLIELFALDEALDHLEVGLAAAERDGAGNWLVRCLGHLAHALMLTADVDRSREVAARAWAILEQVTAPPGLTFLHGGHAYVATAEVWLAMGDAERAEQALTPLLEAGEAAGWLEVIATASFALGRARMAVGDGDGADQRLTRALEVAEGSGLASVEWRTHASAAVLRRAQGRTDEAEGHLSRSHAVIDRTAAGIMDAKLRRAFRHGARAALSG